MGGKRGGGRKKPTADSEDEYCPSSSSSSEVEIGKDDDDYQPSHLEEEDREEEEEEEEDEDEDEDEQAEPGDMDEVKQPGDDGDEKKKTAEREAGGHGRGCGGRQTAVKQRKTTKSRAKESRTKSRTKSSRGGPEKKDVLGKRKHAEAEENSRSDYSSRSGTETMSAAAAFEKNTCGKEKNTGPAKRWWESALEWMFGTPDEDWSSGSEQEYRAESCRRSASRQPPRKRSRRRATSAAAAAAAAASSSSSAGGARTATTVATPESTDSPGTVDKTTPATESVE